MTSSTPYKPPAESSAAQVIFAFFFWTFNVSLLLVVFLGFLPFLGLGIIRDALLGEVPLSILIPAFGLVGVPLTSTAVGLQRPKSSSSATSPSPFRPHSPHQQPQHKITSFNRKQAPAPQPPNRSWSPFRVRQPLSLVQIFFGIEAPLLMACVIRLFFLRDLTPAGVFLFISLTVGAIASIHCFLHPQPSPGQSSSDKREGDKEKGAVSPLELEQKGKRTTSPLVPWLHFAGLTIIAVLSLYLAAIAFFYIPPILYASFFLIAMGFVLVVLSPILIPLGILFGGLVLMPGGMVVLFYKSWRRSLNHLSQRYGQAKPQIFAATVLAVWIGLFMPLQHQPQKAAFQLLDERPQSSAEVQTLLNKSNLIRQGLLNAYLSEYRYPLVDNNWMTDVYGQYGLGFPDAIADGIQLAYNTVLTPFAYQGTAADKDKAAELYAAFFDTPILRGEHQSIQTAVLSNFNRAEAKAGLLDINAHRVQIEQQDVTITPHGDWAEVELHEVYANQTLDTMEVLYSFSLPETATVTGLWLGETGDRAQRYEYDVSTRGAAQEVYNNQVQRQVDPALLEQVGPRNYRLRAFPIPPRGQDQLPKDGNADRMHLWLTYSVLKQDDQWMMPVLNERRNVFWNGQTVRTLNGERSTFRSASRPFQNGFPLKKKAEIKNEEWLPTTVPTNAISSPEPVDGSLPQVAVSGGYIVAKPVAKGEYGQPEHQHLAVIVDGSYSMTNHRDELVESWQWMQENVLDRNQVDVYLTHINQDQAEKTTQAVPFDPKETLFYGSIPTRQMLEQFAATPDSQTTAYDGIILLTDAGSYELSEDGEPLNLSAPLWMVHLGGMPGAYDDATLETIQRTGGNVDTQLAMVMTRMATQPSLGANTSLLNVADGYGWFLRQDRESDMPTVTLADHKSIAPMAARQWVAQVSEAVKPDDLSQLDAIHQVAEEASIVTPYSSMIVLVNDAQRQQLKDAEAREDRFDREIEDQELPAPQKALSPVSAVPEPSEWVLVLAGWVLLVVFRPQISQIVTD